MANHTILIVDYEPRGVEQLREPLESLGFTVAVASDGVEGESAHRDLAPALTFVEVMLPKRSGLDLCRDLKAAGASAPIVVMTSRFAAKRYRKLAIAEYHADQFLEKPIEPSDLHIVLNQLVTITRPGAESIVEASTGVLAPNGEPVPSIFSTPVEVLAPVEASPATETAFAEAPTPAPTPATAPAPAPPAGPAPPATPAAAETAAPAPPEPAPAAPVDDSQTAADDIETRIDELLSDPFGSDS